MTEVNATREVTLGAATSASSFFHDLLVDAIDTFSDVFAGLSAPKKPAVLKRELSRFLIAFEQRRCASSQAGAVAQHIVNRAHGLMRLQAHPLTELPLSPGLDIDDTANPSGTPGWWPEVRFEETTYRGAEVGALVDQLHDTGLMGTIAAEQLKRAVGHLDGEGRLDLQNERFAILGAGSEIAPTRVLLEAGATVLWCDIHPPPDDWRVLPGRLLHARGRGDLLAVPDQVASAVTTFAQSGDGRPVHLGMFAYAPGKGREWRLGAAMNAVARAIPKDNLRSVGLYVSPTSPATPESGDVELAKRRWTSRPAWARALTGVGVLRPNRSQPDLPWVADVIVPIQGVSYQAAQYIEKRLAVEALALDRPELRISAPVAPITKTKSIEHPIFAAAFRGTRIFRVEAFPSDVTRPLCALLYLEDVLGTPRLGPRYFHGGLYNLPYALEGAIRVAAVKGGVTRA